MTSSSTPFIDDLFAAVQSWKETPPWEPVESIKNDKIGWSSEVDRVVHNLAALESVLQRHLKPGEANDPKIATTFERIQILSDYKTGSKLAGALLQAYLQAIPAVRREALLRRFTGEPSDDFPAQEGWLEPSICALDLPVEFLREWFVNLLPKSGGGPGWIIVSSLTRAKPAVALEIACDHALENAEPGRSLRVKILGGLRYRTSPTSAVADSVQKELIRLRDNPDTHRRIDYLRTFAAPFWDGLVPADEREQLIARLDAALPAERAIGFELMLAALTGPKPSPEQRASALRWLKRHASPDLGAEQKRQVVHAAWTNWTAIDSAALGFDSFDLILAVQPVAIEEGGIWQETEHVLQEMLHADAALFRRNLCKLAHKYDGTLQKILERGNLFRWIFRELRQVAWGPSFIFELCDSADTNERHLGRYLVESLQLPAPETAGKIFEPAVFAIWLAEFQASNAYRTVGEQLLAAAPRIDPSSPAMIREFQQEVYFQCVNLPGQCLEKFRAKLADLPILKPAVEAAESYFKNLNELAQSPIKQQQIPGMRRYLLRKLRLERKHLEEEIEKNSIFAKLVHKSYLLYGNRHANVMDGKLSAPSELQSIETSTELPRMEIIDPDTCQRRRVHALILLEQLKGKSAG